MPNNVELLHRLVKVPVDTQQLEGICSHGLLVIRISLRARQFPIGGERSMLDNFVSLYAYNRWADRHVLSACRKLTPEQYVAEPAPGWSSVRATMVHIAVVTEGWLRGL